jgi:hypothetical protein
MWLVRVCKLHQPRQTPKPNQREPWEGFNALVHLEQQHNPLEINKPEMDPGVELAPIAILIDELKSEDVQVCSCPSSPMSPTSANRSSLVN